MLWIGVTGGISSGKSTACRLLEDLGVPIIDADLLSREAIAMGTEGYLKVIKHFGSEVLGPGREINRAKLGQIVFVDKAKRQLLESLIHPIVRSVTIERRMELQREGVKMAVNDVPLLFEKNLQQKYDAVWVVYCHREQQIERLRQRNSLSTSEALLRINSQISIDEKKPLASFVIDNTGDRERLKVSVRMAIDSVLVKR